MRHSSVQPARPCRKRLQASQNGDSRVVVKLFVTSAETIARKQASHKRTTDQARARSQSWIAGGTSRWARLDT